ncbi:putative F-box protein At2g16220 [Capsella rubella]|uniref:putative F-box protein At2g16220 n=1 Tax=Capsella rubella TaxID=81985 RepID=UPI000CD5558C|nr:putative F-box protein At2g16220 [Capsella rubella]
MSRAKHSNYIPTDLYFEIFSRSPPKSIARSRCVSKLWKSMLSSPSFKELFLTRSWARPRLLFAIKRSHEWRFFSSPQYPYDDEKSSLQVAATDLHVKLSGKSLYKSTCMCSFTSGLLCFPNKPISGIRSEKFKFVDASCFDTEPDITLVNYKEDVEKHEWSKYVHSFGGRLDSKFCDVIGMTSTGEIVCSGEGKFDEPIRFLYFDPERDTVKIVQIQGLKYRSMVYTFVDHVEDLNVNDVKPLKSSLRMEGLH